MWEARQVQGLGLDRVGTTVRPVMLRDQPRVLEDLERLLYKESGLLGLSGISNDLRALHASDDPRAAEALDYFVYRIGQSLGALCAALGGLDALVFTAGIGENAAPVRAMVCDGLGAFGLVLDPARNDAGAPLISAEGSPARILVRHTDEEAMIARHTLALAEQDRH